VQNNQLIKKNTSTPAHARARTHALCKIIN